MVARLTPTPVGFCARPSHAQNRGGQGRNRTSDTRIFSPLLYQLSYLAGPVRPGSECGKGARIIRGIRPLAKNTRRWLQSPRFTHSKVTEPKASAAKRRQRIARRVRCAETRAGPRQPRPEAAITCEPLGLCRKPKYGCAVFPAL